MVSKNEDIILNYFQNGSECNPIEVHKIYPSLNDQKQFRLKDLSEVRYYFIDEIREKEVMSKRLSKYITFFIIAINL